MEENKDDIKIFISYHKDSEIIESKMMTPIHVGAKNSDTHLPMLRDDSGVNISDKNNKYCELTAQYWVWKNIDASYYGFMHYRRHFVFNDVEYPFDDGRPVFYENIDKRYQEEIGLNDDEIDKGVRDFDLILPLPVDTSSWGAMSNEIQFSCLENLHAADFDIVCNTVTELYPDYFDAVQEFRTSHYAYWYNMFVMKKDIFVDYSEWLFCILENAEPKIDFSQYNQQEIRSLAFMAERLLSIYMIKLFKDKPELKVKHLKMTFVENTDKQTFENKEYIEKLEKNNSELDYVYCVEKAYKELKCMKFSYKWGDMLSEKGNKLEASLQKKEIIFYGGGNWCKQLLSYFSRLGIKEPIEIWDREVKAGQTINGIQMRKTDADFLSEKEDKLWIITIRNQSVSDTVKRFLEENGVTDIVDNRELVRWLSYQLWMDIA